MKVKYYKVEVTLLDQEGDIIANVLTSDIGQTRLVKLFNDLARQIIEESDKAWGNS